MKKIALLFFVAFIYACTPSTTTDEVTKGEISNLIPEATNTDQYVLEEVGNGISLATKRNETGHILEQGFMKDGKKQGTWKVYEKTFDFPKYLVSYVDGAYNGPFFEYTERGQVEIQSNYKDNKLHGHWGQYKFGRIIKTSNYIDGLMDGVYKELNQRDENPKVEAHYKKGKQHGPMKYYDDKGRVILEYTFNNGVKVGEGKTTKYEE